MHLLLLFSPFPCISSLSMLTCRFSISVLHFHSVEKKNDYFVYIIFSSSLCSLLVSQILIRLFSKIAHKKRKHSKRLQKMHLVWWKKNYKFVDCDTVTGYLLLKSLKWEEKYYKWAQKQRQIQKKKIVTTPTAFRGSS